MQFIFDSMQIYVSRMDGGAIHNSTAAKREQME